MATEKVDTVSERTVELVDSKKSANYGSGQTFNQVKRIAIHELSDGRVEMNFYSRKKNSSGHTVIFSPDDWKKYQEAVYPVTRRYEGTLGVKTPVSRWSNSRIKVGLDEQGNPVIVLYKQDSSIRIYWQEILKWAGSGIQLKGAQTNDSTKEA